MIKIEVLLEEEVLLLRRTCKKLKLNRSSSRRFLGSELPYLWQIRATRTTVEGRRKGEAPGESGGIGRPSVRRGRGGHAEKVRGTTGGKKVADVRIEVYPSSLSLFLCECSDCCTERTVTW